MTQVYSYRWSRPNADEGGVFFVGLPDGIEPKSYFLGRCHEAEEDGLVLTEWMPCPTLQHFRVAHTTELGEDRIWDSFDTDRDACIERWENSVRNPESIVTSFQVLES